jgi:hypothetical protein
MFCNDRVLLQLWWRIGRTILDRQAEEGWGTKVLDRLAADLRTAVHHDEGFLPPESALHAGLR